MAKLHKLGEQMKSFSPLVAWNLVFIIAVMTFAEDDLGQRKIACQRALDIASFQFKVDEANAAYSLKQCDAKWQIQMINAPNSGNVAFRFVCNGNRILALDGHSQSVFRIGKTTLFFAHFSPTKTGCVVNANDLDNGNQVWRAELDGIGKVGHEQYRNRVTMAL